MMSRLTFVALAAFSLAAVPAFAQVKVAGRRRLLLASLSTLGTIACRHPSSSLGLGSAAATELGTARPARASAPALTRLPLWPEGLPPPRFVPRAGSAPEHELDERLYAVREPAVSIHLAPTERSSSTAVLVCPGGGYRRIALVKEGLEVARWLNGLGISAFVLRYRLAEFGHPAPLQDVLRALRLLRSRAAELSFLPDRLGVLGFSAGGHLAGCAATLFDDPAGKTGSPLDAIDARPSFAVLLYPVVTLTEPDGHAGSREALLGPAPDPDLIRHLSIEQQVTARTPPMFLMHTRDDPSVSAQNSLLLRRALTQAGVPNRLELYEHGPHGVGLRPEFEAGRAWPIACAQWLEAQGLM